jgi:hypothetical protein
MPISFEFSDNTIAFYSDEILHLQLRRSQ